MKNIQFIALTLFLLICNRSLSQVLSAEYKYFYYKNGSVSSEGFLHDNKPNGYWKSYYENGNIKSEGNRKDFLLDSLWKFYNEEGNITLSIEYKQGKKSGTRTTYHKDIIIEENFVDNIKSGMEYTLDYFGIILKSINFDNNSENGWQKEFDNTGKLFKITKYVNGYILSSEYVNRLDNNEYKQGKWVDFYKNGNISKEEFYINNKLTGYCKYYDERGNLKEILKYENGEKIIKAEETVKTDIKKDYYSDGKIRVLQVFKNNIPDGVRREYDTTGNITKSFIFEKGEIVGEGIIDEQMKKHGDWKEYYSDGNIKSKGRYLNGEKDGKWFYYYKDGSVEQEGEYIGGKYDNTWLWYYSDGSLLREENFKNGTEEGSIIEYMEDGRVTIKGKYKDGKEEGIWFYNIGDVTTNGSYNNGKKTGVWITKNNDNIIVKKENFLEDNYEGKQYDYYSSGKLFTEKNYINGVEDGDWFYFQEDGEIYLIITYQFGEEIKYNQEKI